MKKTKRSKGHVKYLEKLDIDPPPNPDSSKHVANYIENGSMQCDTKTQRIKKFKALQKELIGREVYLEKNPEKGTVLFLTTVKKEERMKEVKTEKIVRAAVRYPTKSKIYYYVIELLRGRKKKVPDNQ